MNSYGKPGTAEGPWEVRETAPHIATWMVFDASELMVCEVTNREVAWMIANDHNRAFSNSLCSIASETEMIDLIESAIDDSMDIDWTSRLGAEHVYRALVREIQ